MVSTQELREDFAETFAEKTLPAIFAVKFVPDCFSGRFLVE